MKRNLSTSLSAVLAFSLVAVSPGIAAAQSIGASVESAASVSASASAAPAALSGAARIGSFAAPLTPVLAAPISGLSVHGAPAAETPAASAAASTEHAAAPAAVVPEAAVPVAAPAAAAEEISAVPAAAVAPHSAATVGDIVPGAADAEHVSVEHLPEIRPDASDRVGFPASTARRSGFAGMRSLFDGWRGRGAAVDADEPAVAEHGETGRAPSGLSPATADRSAAAPSAPGVPSPRVQKAVRLVGGAVSLYMMARWLAPHLAGFDGSPVANFLGSIHPAAVIGSAVIGGVSALAASHRAGENALRGVGASISGAAQGAAKANVALTIGRLAFNGLSMVGLNPLWTLASAVVLGRSAYSALSNPDLSPRARILRVLPAAAGALLLAGQAVLIFSVASVPQLVAAVALGAGAVAAVAQAAMGRADSRAAGRSAIGMIVSALALGAAVFVYAPGAVWLFVAAGVAGLLISLAGLVRALRTPAASAFVAPVAEPESPAHVEAAPEAPADVAPHVAAAPAPETLAPASEGETAPAKP